MSLPPAPRSDTALIAFGGGLLCVLLLIAVLAERSPPWRGFQEATRAWVAEHAGPERAARVPEGVQQVWLPRLGRVDRCTTCHTTIGWGAETAAAPQPTRSHPHPELLEAHPVETFGCTLCHGGQGPATTQAAAHGDVAFWEEPLLDSARAARVGLTRAELMEFRCNRCHQEASEVAGMPLLNEAKALVVRFKCARCHTIHGQGATEAPDLTYVGDKHATQLHFPAGWGKERTALAWHIAHLRDPASMTPDSEMPPHPISPRQAAAIALLVLSWQRMDLPAAYTPDPAVRTGD